MKNGERRTEKGERRTENGERRTENGERRTENGERRTENGERRTENGERRTENGEPPALRGPDEREPVAGARVVVPAHAPDRSELVGVNLVVLDDGLVHVEPYDLANHEAPAHRARAHLDNLHQPAFHVDVRLLH